MSLAAESDAHIVEMGDAMTLVVRPASVLAAAIPSDILDEGT